ncbi:hypothetical protein IDH44_01635 [Paenibacillus sp. IB182496]|uniref:Uncharacterized protein n=1 Tax=Paenibacillus sabuli TaxID=2772509 RepID=A0A927BQL1_9BACL|nr:hypothetical protein [Paenibacillus sabuli]MBD2843880.1 hypothetical protein [Paenibacillus sabuli]
MYDHKHAAPSNAIAGDGAARDRIAALRELELYAYRVAVYLLGEGTAAEEAAKTALLELARHRTLGGVAPRVQQALAKRAVMKCALAIRRETAAQATKGPFLA